MKKLLLSGLSAAILLGSFNAAWAEDAPKTVNIGYQKANIFALLKYRGTLDSDFSKQGITVRWVEFPAGPQMLEGLNVGSIDLAATGDAPPTFAQAAKADLVYLAHSPANPQTEAIVVPENSPIKTVADLKGKRVALNKGSDVNYLLVSALENAGLKYKDVTPVYLPPSDARAAFQRGAVDAWVIWDPYLAEVETHEKARLVKNAEGLVPHYTFYLASRKFADTYPQTAEKVVDELKQLSDWANKNPDGAADILSTSTGLDKAIWAKAVARMPFGAERMTPEVFKEQQALADKFSEIGLLPVKVNVSSATWSLDKK
ncbi:MAG: sulfonate ABC transporter substrate-binding protein [Ewingella americana]|jgi:sulfonate transport system substrate-binding protein|uniref:sulfonate ABC transporter substrate-binding protein n=1 Tax=Ewingella TaxID=41201 RepID=UPI000C2FEF6C|nr:sulfonate ABC transporter substrate-binding protein [Ewingella americana]MCI1676677.1 sulfonate ABC transporter substrate-binding protein [Ewingella americana]MCI1853733.1 sulfonate ABC transporter substrate-binding protein [Ewingella americana]MCI1860026.1 sulfonate ABC transporter substrate-binding protein [Ewingella americana]MCI2142354.1 sulfonate ABC transporter substrate-binding protein [Ewingella americana]MCI2163317.1 sulfonate ABC transporter substrate-binding protein [Ewingella am